MLKRSKTPLTKNGDFTFHNFTLYVVFLFFVFKKLIFKNFHSKEIEQLMLVLLLTLNFGRLVAIQVLRTGKWGTPRTHASSGTWRRHKTALRTHSSGKMDEHFFSPVDKKHHRYCGLFEPETVISWKLADNTGFGIARMRFGEIINAEKISIDITGMGPRSLTNV